MTALNHECIQGTVVLTLASLGHTLPLLPEVGTSPPTPPHPTHLCSALQGPMLLAVALPMSAHLEANNEEISGQLLSLVTSLLGHLQSQKRLSEILKASCPQEEWRWWAEASFQVRESTGNKA